MRVDHEETGRAGASPGAVAPRDVRVQLRGVQRRFRDGRGEREVLRGIDLEVRAGEFVALMGPSGSGKSTLLSIAAGLERADAGQIVVAGLHLRALDARGLAGREDDRPDNLSGGEQQRVAIARAFAGAPRALLLDEVTSALDPELVGEVLAAVRDLKAEGMTMVLATHEMGFAREVADQVAFLHDGRILELGPPEQVLEHPRREETRRFLSRLLEAGRI
jgi:ABC-type polar amino acid transport system ATPase subunit